MQQNPFPKSRYLKKIEVTLEPGDILYMPAYTFHNAIIKSGISMSLNIWTDPKEINIIDGILKSILPFESEWNQNRKRQGVATFISELIKQVLNLDDNISCSKCNIQEYLFNIVGNRYKNLMDLSILPSKVHSKEFCKFNNDEKYVKKSSLYSKSIVNQLIKVSRKHRDIISGDYIEEITLWGVDVKHIGYFLNNCFK